MSFMLSTLDNPYNPHHEWDRWLTWDHDHGYHSSEYLARIAKTSEELSETDYELAIQDAIDEIVQEDIIGVYIKVDAKFKPKVNQASAP